MRLYQIIKSEEILALKKPNDFEIGKPISDSRKLSENDIFFCEDGFHESGYSYVGRAIAKGASCIVTARGGSYRIGKIPIPVLEVADVRKSYALAWSRFEGCPEKDLRLIAVTGTNGKTSVSSFLCELLRLSGESAGLIGTVEYSDGLHAYTSAYTTPPPDVLYPLLSEMKKAGNHFVIMEASSHAIVQQRLHGLSFETAIFTGLSRDHLDYHKTWEAYRDAKAALFKQAKNALLNADDAEAHYMGYAATGDVYYYGKRCEADFRILAPIAERDHICYTLCMENKDIPVKIPVTGKFHIYNTAAAIAAASLAGIPAETLQNQFSFLKAPCGRLEKLPLDTDFSIYIDYAHSPDALANALLSLRPFTKKLTVLFGAGGERDRGKRPEMGAIAEEFADFVILTSDNPRKEAPLSIINEIQSGMNRKNHICMEDRTSAIAYAIENASPGEIILLAGKGHETYAVDANGIHDFSEKEIVKRILIDKRKGNDNVSQPE